MRNNIFLSRGTGTRSGLSVFQPQGSHNRTILYHTPRKNPFVPSTVKEIPMAGSGVGQGLVRAGDVSGKSKDSSTEAILDRIRKRREARAKKNT